MTDDRIINIFEQHGQYVTPKDYALIRSIAEAVAPHRTTAEGEDTRRAWVGLTDEQVEAVAEEFGVGGWICDFARAIEAELKEKNDR